MKNVFPTECLKIYRKRFAKNGILVVLPSLGNKFLPYFTRVKWQDMFPDKCFIACADPSLLDNFDTLNGTWFLDSAKGSRLLDFATWLRSFIDLHVDENNPKLIFAGSSMGGYASIYLANLFPGSYAFAECPQTNLLKYAGSKKAIEHICQNESSCLEEHINLASLIQKYNRVPNVHIFIPVTDVHHLRMHVAPYARAVGDFLKNNESNIKDVYFKISIEQNESLPIGHAPIPKHLFKEYIDSLFFEMANSKSTKKSFIQILKKYFVKLIK